MEQHVSNVCRTAYYELRRIGSIRHLLTPEATKTLVCAFVLSRLDYCNSLLSGCPSTLINKLQMVQNHAARLVLKTRKKDHITPMLLSLHWLPVTYRIQYKVLCLCYSFFSGSSPVYLSQLLRVYVPGRELRTSADSRILDAGTADSIPHTKTNGKRAFSFQGPLLWNSLPKHIRHSDSLVSFKSSLKTYFFQKNFSNI